MLPFLMAERAPLWNPLIPGAFLGVRRHHTTGHFVRAAVEGMALLLSTVVDELDKVTPVREVRATGGVFRARLWRDILAAALGKPLVVTGGAEGTAMGASALALYGLGREASLREAVEMLHADDSKDAEPYVAPKTHVAAYKALKRSIPQTPASNVEVAKLYTEDPDEAPQIREVTRRTPTTIEVAEVTHPSEPAHTKPASVAKQTTGARPAKHSAKAPRQTPVPDAAQAAAPPVTAETPPAEVAAVSHAAEE